MIRSYLKIAIRNLKRNKTFSIINILGLATGMAAAMLILLWIHHEWSFDRFHEKKDRIYEAWNRSTYKGEVSCWSASPKVLASALQRDNPEIETTARVNWPNSMLFSAGEKSLMADGHFVDSSFLKIFSFPVKSGDPNGLMDPNGLVITEKLATKLFGSQDPIGKMVKVENRQPLVVKTVLYDVPKNGRFQFEYLIPWAVFRANGGDDTYWGNNSVLTYVLVKENAGMASLVSRVRETRRKYQPEEKDMEFFLYPLERWHLYSSFKNGVEDGGFIEFIRLFFIIAVFILLIACINFMNLSTARSEKRAREVGIRKVIGAGRSSLIRQFLGESVLISLIAGVLALIMVQLSLPAFSQLTGKQISIAFREPGFWFFFMGFIILTGILAGSYPALFLSRFQPVTVLKGSFRRANSAVTPRKVLVVLQFSFAIILIIATIVVRDQIRYGKDKEPGYNRNNVVFLYINEDLGKNFQPWKDELLASGAAVSITKSMSPVTENWSNTTGIEWPGKEAGDKTLIDRFSADDKVSATLGLEIIKGRDLDIARFPTDSFAALVNESAVKAMKLKDPLGTIIKDDGHDFQIVGVFRDFVVRSPFHPIAPMIIQGSGSFFSVVHVKLNTAQPDRENLKKMEAITKKFSPAYPFDAFFVDQQYAKKFESEERSSRLAGLFAGLAIFISCLGLLGLAAYMAESRIKEIGVRKVLGASVLDITTLLSKDFLKLVAISFLIASPLAYWALHSWLESYPYRINIPVSAFLLAALLSMLIALVTVSSQAVRAAVSNPVKSLRTE